MPIRVLGKGGSGSLQDIADGILYGARLPNSSGALPPQRCNVMNMSLGGPGSTTVLQQACDDAAAAGVLLIAASGNDNSSTMNFPASYTSVVSVGSTDYVRARAPYSNFASNIDIWAPGGNQRVDLNADSFPDGVLSTVATGFATTRTASYTYLQGTSMASPHVAGVAALMLAVKPAMTLSEFKGILASSAQAGNNLPNSGVLIDAHAAVLAAQSGGPTTPILVATPNAVNFDPGETAKSVTMANKGTGTLTYEPTKSGFTYKSGTGWLIPTIVTGGTNITHNRLDIVVNPTGQANGKYEALVTVVYSSGGSDHTALITITMHVGSRSASGETIFVLVVDFDTLNTNFQATTTAGQSYLYAVPAVTVGSYLIAAGTDRDNDGFIGDAGELFGVWPSWDFPLILSATGTGQTRNGLDFDLGLIIKLSTGKERPKFKLLPRR
jgi:serine protease